MNQKIDDWMIKVEYHNKKLQDLTEERNSLKNSMEEILKSCFEWHEIEFSNDLSKIKLIWNHGVSPVIKYENIAKLGMDIIVSSGMDTVIVEVYPWGVKEGFQLP